MSVTYIRLYGGQQDGLMMQTSAAPSVVWVPTIEEERRLDARKHAPKSAPTNHENLLPYVKFRAFTDAEGDNICDFEFCEDLLVHAADEE